MSYPFGQFHVLKFISEHPKCGTQSPRRNISVFICIYQQTSI